MMRDKLKLLDLFSGIGGFSLGLERTGGFETVAFCEINPFCQKVLKKHWPNVPCFDDVTKLRGENVGPIDVICGGFPCQDISFAGKGAGLEGERSGLWSEIARLVGELRPQFVIVENVSALLGRGLGVVLGDLAALGYDAEWHCIPASAVGAPHRRDRVWIVGYTSQLFRNGCGENRKQTQRQISEFGKSSGEVTLADASSPRLSDNRGGPAFAWSSWFATAYNASGGNRTSHDWRVEPDVGRVANGVPGRVDRLKGLGNAVVPQIPELIGNAILETIDER